MTDNAVQQFATYLAGITEPAERARTIARANMLAMQAAPDEAFEPPIRTLKDYLAAEIEIPPVLVTPNLLVRGGLNVTIGRAGKGKTVMNLNRLMRWAAGLPMFDGWQDKDGEPYLMPAHPLKILIVENEGAAGLFHQQIGIMANASEFIKPAARKLIDENIFIWGEGGYSGMKLDDPAKLKLLRDGVEKWEPDLVFIEPLRSLWSGDENSSTEMNEVVDALVALSTDFNCATLMAHHERKAGAGDDGEKMSAGRGSTVLEGIVTAMENFESIKSGEQRELTWSKMRYAAAPSPVRMSWVNESQWYEWVPVTHLEESVLTALRDNGDEPMSIKDLCDELEETQSKLRPVLKKMEEDKQVRKLPSVATSNGSTGHRFRLPSQDNDGFGGLSL